MNLRLAYRYLLRTPAFAAFSILELALGIGLTTTAFFVINAVLLRPLDLPDPGRLVQLQNIDKKTGKIGNSVPGLDFRDIRDQARTFTAIAAYWAGQESVLMAGHTEQVRFAAVSRGWHETVGVYPMLGAGLFSNGPQEDGALISERFWRTRAGGDRGILGSTVQVEGKVYAIKGVMPGSGVFPENTDLWLPIIPENDGSSRTAFNYRVIARMKPGITLGEAKANLASVAAALERQYPENKNRGYTLLDLRERIVGSYRAMLFTLGGAVLVVLVIACANVVNLLLARAVSRQREMAIRMALGARARHLFSVLLAESSLVAVLGGALGLLLAAWARDLLVTLNPFPVPRLAAASMDITVMAFAAAASIACGVLTGLLPAWRVWRSDVHEALAKAGSRSVTSGEGLRSSILVVEVAFSVLLLAGAALLLRSFARVSSVDPGFRVENLAVLECDLTPIASENPQRAAAFFDDVRARALSLPGVVAAGWNRDLPARASGQNGAVFVEGRPKPGPADYMRVYADWHVAGPGFFQALGVPVRMGRDFREEDNATAPPVAVVNEAFVRSFFPHENPLGRRFQIGMTREMKPVTIVGVASNIRELAHPADAELYLPWRQVPAAATQMYLTARVRGPLPPVSEALRNTAAQLMPQAIVRFTTMEEVLSESIATARFRSFALAAFASIAMLLALAGLYAVCSFMVQARTREVGLRMALGARAFSVVTQFIARALRLTAAGAGLGILAAFAMRNVVASFLFDVPPSDWVSYALAVLVLALGAVAASFLPAWRASRTDPAIVLREE